MPHPESAKQVDLENIRNEVKHCATKEDIAGLKKDGAEFKADIKKLYEIDAERKVEIKSISKDVEIILAKFDSSVDKMNAMFKDNNEKMDYFIRKVDNVAKDLEDGRKRFSSDRGSN